MPPPLPQGKTKTFVHIEILNYQKFGVILAIGADPQFNAFRNELLLLMGKYGVKRIDAVLVPCNRDQVIKFEVEGQYPETKDKDPSDDISSQR